MVHQSGSGGFEHLRFLNLEQHCGSNVYLAYGCMLYLVSPAKVAKPPTRIKRTAISLYLGRAKNYKLTLTSFGESFTIVLLCLSSQLTQWAAVITCLRPIRTMKTPSCPHLHPPIRVPEHLLTEVGSAILKPGHQRSPAPWLECQVHKYRHPVCLVVSL